MAIIDYSQEFKENYRQIIPAALTLLTERLDEHLTGLFGSKINNLDYFSETTTKTKLVSPAFCMAMEDTAKDIGWSYTDVDTVGYDTEAADPVDDVIIRVEDKLTFGNSAGAFATGNNHSKVKDYLHLVVKLQNSGNVFTDVFAALIDVPALKNPRSGWDDNVTASGKNNNGFSSLKVTPDDWNCIDVIYGDLKTNPKWMHTRYEAL